MSQPISPLVADLITASLTQTRAVTDRLIENLTEQLAEAHAREDAVRSGIETLLSSPYMPTPDAIRSALYPSAEIVAMFRVREESR